jgi:hypothetical protein
MTLRRRLLFWARMPAASTVAWNALAFIIGVIVVDVVMVRSPRPGGGETPESSFVHDSNI